MTETAPSDVAALLDDVARRGDRPATSFYRGKTLEGRLTYAELTRAVTALAGVLRARFGVEPGDRVAILGHNRLEVPPLVLALLRLGAVVVPLNPGSAPADWTYILGHSGAKGLCATRELAEQVPAAARTAFTLYLEEALTLASEAPPGDLPLPDVPGGLGEARAVILYTSGTTGDPKGVTLRQRNLLANGASMARNFGLQETTQLAVLPLYHAHAFGFGLMTALVTHGHLVFCERLEPFTWAQVIRAESVSVTSAVPTMLPMILASGVTAEKVPSLRHVMVSSAPLPIDLARAFEDKTRIPLIQGWGLSEYTNFACCVSPRESREEHEKLMFGWEVPSIGPALPGTEVRVVGEDGEPAGEGARGELVVRGPSTMAGYFEDPANTRKALDAEGWLHTGDQGFFAVHGGRPVYFVTGRLKEIIIRDAEKYSPLTLEKRITLALPELSGKLVVLGFPHPGHGEEVGGYLELVSVDGALKERLLKVLEQIPLAERPKVVLFGEAPIPRTHTGKVQRRKMLPWFDRYRTHKGGTVIEPLASPAP